MKPHDQDFLVIGAIENSDVATLRKNLEVPPKIVVVEFFGGRRLEAVDEAALRVESRHHMLDGPVLARSIHGLQNDQKCVGILGIQLALELRQKLNAFAKAFCRSTLAEGAAFFPTSGEVAGQVDLLSWWYNQTFQEFCLSEITRHDELYRAAPVLGPLPSKLFQQLANGQRP